MNSRLSRSAAQTRVGSRRGGHQGAAPHTVVNALSDYPWLFMMHLIAHEPDPLTALNRVRIEWFKYNKVIGCAGQRI